MGVDRRLDFVGDPLGRLAQLAVDPQLRSLNRHLHEFGFGRAGRELNADLELPAPQPWLDLYDGEGNAAMLPRHRHNGRTFPVNVLLHRRNPFRSRNGLSLTCPINDIKLCVVVLKANKWQLNRVAS